MAAAFPLKVARLQELWRGINILSVKYFKVGLKESSR